MKDSQISKLIKDEALRQKKVINLIASENYVSKDVLEALGSVFTNKYSEGYSGRRYYGGNSITDKIEDIAISRALKLFNLKAKDWSVNVQPLSGSPANMAVYTALVPQGGKIMGMSLDHGGHLTHGHKASATGKFWTQVPYGLDQKTERINYDDIRDIAMRERPAIIVAGFTAYSRVVDWKSFRAIADACGALLMVDISHLAGLVAGKAYPSPFPYANIVTHTVHKTLRGPRSAIIYTNIDNRELHKKIDRAVFPGLQGGPHMNQIAAVAVALREADTSKFRSYAKQVVKNAQAMADEFTKLGWKVISQGTDSHLFLLDTWLNGQGLGGKEASDILEKAGIIVNKNAIPFDTRPPTDPSGIRIGTAAETTRGKKERDMRVIARKIDGLLRRG